MSKVKVFGALTLAVVLAALIVLVALTLRGLDNSGQFPTTASSEASTAQVPTQARDSAATGQAPRLEQESATPEDCVLPYMQSSDAGLSDQELADRYLAASEWVTASLVASQDPELLVVAAMFEEDEEVGLELATKAVELAPDNPLVLWNALMDCFDPDLCPSLEWLQQLAVVDSENSDVWMSLAVEQLRLGDEKAALGSLERAANAASANVYYAETIEMGVRAFTAAGSDLPFQAVAEYGFGISTGKLPQYVGYVSLCKTMSKNSPVAAEHCLRYAQQSQAYSKTRIAKSIAADMEAVALEQLGYDGQAASLRERNRQASEISTEAHFGEASGVQALEAYMSYSPANLESFLGHFRTQGELAAFRALEQEKQAFDKQYLSSGCE
ncbi:hypothetical protein [Halioxenophilus aromaticivorans]|uniref:Tetratricopeptide repeat protein n=1 Tax=Halioxenophilus aromaticivorans TaxID=1306992 RepID=A0AAV3U3Z7_9ALTE